MGKRRKKRSQLLTVNEKQNQLFTSLIKGINRYKTYYGIQKKEMVKAKK